MHNIMLPMQISHLTRLTETRNCYCAAELYVYEAMQSARRAKSSAFLKPLPMWLALR